MELNAIFVEIESMIHRVELLRGYL
jgi:hypothetical protein